MSARILHYLVGLSRRERWLLALLVVVALPMAAVFGLILPLSEARMAARSQVHEARLMEEWVAQRAGDYLAQGALLGTDGANQGPPLGISGIELSLVEAGLRQDVTELANSGSGGVTLRFDAAAFTGLTDWLSLNQDSWGYDLEAFRFVRGARDDLVEAEFRLVPAQ
jgi:type II secretory pathway component PulM